MWKLHVDYRISGRRIYLYILGCRMGGMLLGVAQCLCLYSAVMCCCVFGKEWKIPRGRFLIFQSHIGEGQDCWLKTRGETFLCIKKKKSHGGAGCQFWPLLSGPEHTSLSSQGSQLFPCLAQFTGENVGTEPLPGHALSQQYHSLTA